MENQDEEKKLPHNEDSGDPRPHEEEENEEDDENGIDVEKTSEEELASLIERKDRAGLVEVFDKVPTIDISEAADDLSPEQLIYIFRSLPSAVTWLNLRAIFPSKRSVRPETARIAIAKS